jgi:hypothetical protein
MSVLLRKSLGLAGYLRWLVARARDRYEKRRATQRHDEKKSIYLRQMRDRYLATQEELRRVGAKR